MSKRPSSLVVLQVGPQARKRLRTGLRTHFVTMSDEHDVKMRDIFSKIPSSTKRARTDAQDGAVEVGQGHQVTIPRAVPHLYNNNYTVRLTYADNYRHDITQNGAASAIQTFRMNSIFDPDITGGGHQPLMRDLWASQYDYYAVLSCEYKIRLYNSYREAVTFTAAGTSAQAIGCVNATMVLGTTNGLDYVNSGRVFPAAEQKNMHTEFLVPEGFTEFRGTLTPGDFLVDAVDSDNDTTWTAVGANHPITRSFGYVLSPAQWVALTGVSKTPVSTIQVQVILDYTVQFTQMNQSIRTSPS